MMARTAGSVAVAEWWCCLVLCGEGACPRWAAKRPQKLGLLRSPTGASPLATKAPSPHNSGYLGGSILSSTPFAVISATMMLFDIPSNA